MAFRVKVGLEIHARILANTKLFSGASISFVKNSYNANDQVSLFDASVPGTLPSVNKVCVEQAIRTGLALKCKVQDRSVFERKHYFYGDLPLGYQITQQRWPIVKEGVFEYPVVPRTDTGEKNRNAGKIKNKQVRITRIQIEQDSGRMLETLTDDQLLDLNRAGSGVMEIVTEPDMDSAIEAACFVESMQVLLRTIGTCDGNMQDGSLRADVNVSVHSNDLDSHRVEVKNLNSFRSVIRAVEYEARRLEGIYTAASSKVGTEHQAETRTFNVSTGETEPLRTKELAADYRFFPEPDLLPIHVSEETIKTLRDTLPELPEEILSRLTSPPYNLSKYDACVLFGEPGCIEYFEQVLGAHIGKDAKPVADYVTSVLLGALNKAGWKLSDDVVRPQFYGALISLAYSGVISRQTVQQVLASVIKDPSLQDRDPIDIVKERQLEQINDVEALEALVEEVLAEEKPDTKKGKQNVRKFFDGDEKIYHYFFGVVQRKVKGRANPSVLKKAYDKAQTRLSTSFRLGTGERQTRVFNKVQNTGKKKKKKKTNIKDES